MDDIFNRSLTLQDRVAQMKNGGAEAFSDHCDFASKIDLQLLLLTLEAAMLQSNRLDINQGQWYLNRFANKHIFMAIHFEQKEARQKISLHVAEAGHVFDLWFTVQGNQLRITSFAPVNLYHHK
jgi:hypothetical protein